jgi:hypothetical protein
MRRVLHSVVFGNVYVGCIGYVPCEYKIVVEGIHGAVDARERLWSETEIAEAIWNSWGETTAFHQSS